MAYNEVFFAIGLLKAIVAPLRKLSGIKIPGVV